MKRTKEFKTNKGITLIALVITIIVMLILVGVTISMAVNGGLFEYAGRAAGQTKNALSAEGQLADERINIAGEWYNNVDEYLTSIKPEESNLSGVWVFNKTISPDGLERKNEVKFRCDYDGEEHNFDGIELGYNGEDPEVYDIGFYNDVEGYVIEYYQNGSYWRDDDGYNFRTVDFGEGQVVSDAFLTWLNANATKQE